MKGIFPKALQKKKQIVHSYERETSSDVPTTPLFACYLPFIALETLYDEAQICLVNMFLIGVDGGP